MRCACLTHCFNKSAHVQLGKTLNHEVDPSQRSIRNPSHFIPSSQPNAVPASLTALSNLTALLLARNYLSEAQLPEESPSLAHLQLLDMSNCEMWRPPPFLLASALLPTYLRPLACTSCCSSRVFEHSCRTPCT